jgi:hypothetical protein
MRALWVLLLSAGPLLAAGAGPGQAKPAAKVYICQGSASYAYHRVATCEGLAWCSSSVKALPKAAAVKLGRRPCGRCAYRN